jgi:hypothetical protein
MFSGIGVASLCCVFNGDLLCLDTGFDVPYRPAIRLTLMGRSVQQATVV